MAPAAAQRLCTHDDWMSSRAFKCRSTSLQSCFERYGIRGDKVEKLRRLEINVGRRMERDEIMEVNKTHLVDLSAIKCVQLCTLRTVFKVHCLCRLCNLL